MTVKKVRQHVAIVEVHTNAFRRDRTRENLFTAVEAIHKFEREIGIVLWDELDALKREWDEKEGKC